MLHTFVVQTQHGAELNTNFRLETTDPLKTDEIEFLGSMRKVTGVELAPAGHTHSGKYILTIASPTSN